MRTSISSSFLRVLTISLVAMASGQGLRHSPYAQSMICRAFCSEYLGPNFRGMRMTSPLDMSTVVVPGPWEGRNVKVIFTQNGPAPPPQPMAPWTGQEPTIFWRHPETGTFVPQQRDRTFWPQAQLGNTYQRQPFWTRRGPGAYLPPHQQMQPKEFFAQAQDMTFRFQEPQQQPLIFVQPRHPTVTRVLQSAPKQIQQIVASGPVVIDQRPVPMTVSASMPTDDNGDRNITIMVQGPNKTAAAPATATPKGKLKLQKRKQNAAADSGQSKQQKYIQSLSPSPPAPVDSQQDPQPGPLQRTYLPLPYAQPDPHHGQIPPGYAQAPPPMFQQRYGPSLFIRDPPRRRMSTRRRQRVSESSSSEED